MLTVPPATPVTTPVPFTVAIDGLPLDHVPPAVVLVRMTLDPAHTGAVEPPIAATAGNALTVIATVELTGKQGPVGSFVVSLSVTVPLKLTAGVYVINAGFAVCAVLLKTPPPETIDHAPVVAPPPIAAPDKVIAPGVADWHTAIGAPAVTIATGFTVTVTEDEFVHPLAAVPVTV